jgi:HD-GYP domain-containing protein (c-di-GMP phosphodiesterase class II)
MDASLRKSSTRLSIETALSELRKCRGNVYDAAVVDAGLSFLPDGNAEWHLTHKCG